MGRTCTRFQANMFSKIRCQNCYKTKEMHSEDALEQGKMTRKVTACGFLYVAPPNIDFSLPSHSAKRWQRRWFSLFDDGELTYSLDNNPETVPQLIMDMNRCIRVCEADPITGHPHSILVAFKNDQLDCYGLPDICSPNCGSENRMGSRSSSTGNAIQHPAVCYVKADSTEEIRWWQNVLQMYAKQNAIHVMPSSMRRTRHSSGSGCLERLSSGSGYSEFAMDSSMSHSLEPTIIQVDSSSHQDSVPSSRSSSNERPLNASNCEMSQARQTNMDLPLFHGTPRSIKNRDRNGREEMTRRPVTESLPTPEPSQILSPPPLPESPALPFANVKKQPIMTPFQIDTSNAYTLRSGWLSLRGKSESEWIRHWVVLAGLSLKLYKDVWAADSSDPQLTIDLTDCENVYPSASAKNYGIEIKCRRARYILSAMTPGIRDSWIAALQQNLHNPSPTYPETSCCASMDGMSQADSADMLSLPPRRKKHIAYVAPESHHSNSLMDDDSLTEADVDDEPRQSVNRNRSRQLSASERSMLSSEVEDTHSRNIPITSSRNEDSPVDRRSNTNRPRHRRRGSRQQSLSPIRRSPVTRIKAGKNSSHSHASENNHTSHRLSPSNTIRTFSTSSSITSQNDNHSRNGSKKQRSSARSSGRQSSASPQEMRLRSLETQVQSLRDQLQETKSRLNETQSENERLRCLFDNSDSIQLSKLRKCLTAAEADVIKQQEEMDALREQLESNDSTIPESCSIELSRRLVSLLKVQVGALSKVLHCSNNTKFASLRQLVDSLIRIVAGLDENAEQNMTKMESAFEEVVNAYEKLSILLDYRQPTTVDEGTNTENLPYEEGSNSELLQEIQDLESEIEELQARGEELESQKFEYERQIKSLRERIEHEENAKRKLQEELQTINSTNEQRLSTLKVSYEETIDELKKQFDSDLKKLKEDHEAELDEEKNATRLALDAVRRAHDEEIQTLTEKYKQQGFQQQPSCSNVNGAPITDSSRQSRMVEQMSTELTNLTTLYSAKCLENSQLDEKLQSVLANKEDQSALNELDLQNRRLQRELRLKESAIDELKDRIGNLERKLEACGESEFSDALRRTPKRSRSRPVKPISGYLIGFNSSATRTSTTNTKRPIEDGIKA